MLFRKEKSTFDYLKLPALIETSALLKENVSIMAKGQNLVTAYMNGESFCFFSCVDWKIYCCRVSFVVFKGKMSADEFRKRIIEVNKEMNTFAIGLERKLKAAGDEKRVDLFNRYLKPRLGERNDWLLPSHSSSVFKYEFKIICFIALWKRNKSWAIKKFLVFLSTSFVKPIA